MGTLGDLDIEVTAHLRLTFFGTTCLEEVVPKITTHRWHSYGEHYSMVKMVGVPNISKMIYMCTAYLWMQGDMML